MRATIAGTVEWELLISTVYPSGAARATCSAPITLPAPARLSTTIGWPRVWPAASAMIRPTMSFEPPGAKGTIIRMGRSGLQACCAVRCARTTVGGARPAARARERARRRVCMKDVSLVPGGAAPERRRHAFSGTLSRSGPDVRSATSIRPGRSHQKIRERLPKQRCCPFLHFTQCDRPWHAIRKHRLRRSSPSWKALRSLTSKRSSPPPSSGVKHDEKAARGSWLRSSGPRPRLWDCPWTSCSETRSRPAVRARKHAGPGKEDR